MQQLRAGIHRLLRVLLLQLLHIHIKRRVGKLTGTQNAKRYRFSAIRIGYKAHPPTYGKGVFLYAILP